MFVMTVPMFGHGERTKGVLCFVLSVWILKTQPQDNQWSKWVVSTRSASVVASKLLWGLFHSPHVFCLLQLERTKSLNLWYHVSIPAMIDSKHGFCLWGTAVFTTLSSCCLRGHDCVPSAVLPASPFPTPAGTRRI